MRTVAVIQARQTSTRLPEKMTMPLADEPAIRHVIRRAEAAPGVDDVCVSIPHGDEQAPLIEAVGDVKVTRGPENDLVERFNIAADEMSADRILRMWGDSPAIDIAAIAQLLDVFETTGADWASIDIQSGYPLGNECQVFTRSTLRSLNELATTESDREIIQAYLRRHPEQFSEAEVKRPDQNPVRESSIQLLLDTMEHYATLQLIFDALASEDPLFGTTAVEDFATRHPYLVRRRE